MIIEECRTKEELINCFKQLGKEITEEEIQALKGTYKQIEENKNNLNLKQLESVAGGGVGVVERFKRFFGVNHLTNEVEMHAFDKGSSGHSNGMVTLSGKEARGKLGDKFIDELSAKLSLIYNPQTNVKNNSEHDFENFMLGFFAGCGCAALCVSGLIISSTENNNSSNESDKNGEILC